MKPRYLILIGLLILIPSQFILAGEWITPNYPQDGEPQFDPVPLLWQTIQQTPYVYRVEITAPEDCNRATVLAKSSGYLFVWVDGKRCFAYAVPEKQKPDPERIHAIDLSDSLSLPGKHLLAVSAPKEGFVLDGGFYADEKRLADLQTDYSWRVAKLPPTTILEDDEVVQIDYSGDSAPVRRGVKFVSEETQLAQAHLRAAYDRAKTNADEAIWRLELLAQKGNYIIDDQPYWWGGPARTLSTAIEGAKDALASASPLRQALQKPFTLQPAQTNESMKNIHAWQADADIFLQKSVDLSTSAWAADEAKMLDLASRVLYNAPLTSPMDSEGMKSARDRLTKKAGHPLNRLNESRYDRLGWLPLPGLSDDDMGTWGVRINPISGPTAIEAPSRWIYMTDPNNSGVEELRWSIGYNIENQWPRIDIGKSWQKEEKFKDYKGISWYRVRLAIPSEWAGNDIAIAYTPGGVDRLWFNDMEIAKTQTRSAVISSSIVRFGGENCIAIRIENNEDGGGILSKVEISCPDLSHIENAASRVDILSTPLSPCVILTPQTETIEIHHAPGAQLLIPGKDAPRIRDYEQQRDGKLSQNWAILWMKPQMETSQERPVMLVFSSNPLKIQGEENVTRIVFSQAGQRIVAMRPWVKKAPPETWEEMKDAVEFWRRAALMVPVNYASITRLERLGESIERINIHNIPRGPLLRQTMIYNYVETKDEWDTPPLKIAPLPALCSCAMDNQFLTLQVDSDIQIEQDGGMLATYRAALNTDRIEYSYEVEPYPRRAGFTSWMFGGADVGVSGNYREMELIASTGANSYRPQHNFSNDKSPHFPGRTRLEIMFDACMKAGVNYTNNIDQTLGKPREYVRDHYDQFMDEVVAHYEIIARALKDAPFWAAGYDLINEPFDHQHERYNPAIKRLTEAVRKIDGKHLLYIEPCESWGAIQQILAIEPTGDPLTVYSYHDYNFRLNKPEDRWPSLDRDITNICQLWLPAFQFAAQHRTALHCGEFGDFRNECHQNENETLLLNDFLRLFDQFGMHHHYYSGRVIFTIEPDGSLTPSNIARTYRKYFSRPDFNLYYQDELWPGYPDPQQYWKYSQPSYNTYN